MIVILHWSDWIIDPKVERVATYADGNRYVNTLPNDRSAWVFDTHAPNNPWRGLDHYRGRRLAEIYMALGGEPIASGRFTNYDSGRRRTEALIMRLAAESPEIQLPKEKFMEQEATQKKQRKPRAFKPPKLGQFTPVRSGSKLARFVALVSEGTRTLDQLATAYGVEKKDINLLLRSSLAKMHGIGHTIDADTGIIYVDPNGPGGIPLIKTPTEPKAKSNGSLAPRRTKHDDAMERARTGEMPPHLVITSEANKHRQKKVDQLEKLAADGDWDGVSAFNMNGIDTYSKMINRHRDLLLAARNAAGAE